MNQHDLGARTISPTLLVAVVVLLCNPCFADYDQYRVSFLRVPGAAAIEAGDLQAGIKKLESQIADTGLDADGDTLATLCAAYIVDRSLDKAAGVCDEAVRISPTNAAYNNRGVFRALTGDLSGAREDFKRVRPAQLEVYLEELKNTDIPLVASENYDLAERMLFKQRTEARGRSFTSSGASIENVVN